MDWRGPDFSGFYRAMFALRRSSRALANGASGGVQRSLEASGGSGVYAYERVRGRDAVVVLLNFGDAPAVLAYRGVSRPGRYRDWIGGGTVRLAATGTVTVPAHGYRVLAR